MKDSKKGFFLNHFASNRHRSNCFPFSRKTLSSFLAPPWVLQLGVHDRDSFLSVNLLFSIWIVWVCTVNPLAYCKELNKVYKEAETCPYRYWCAFGFGARERFSVWAFYGIRAIACVSSMSGVLTHIKLPGVLFRTVGL